MNKKNQLGKMNLNKKVMNIYIEKLYSFFIVMSFSFWHCKDTPFSCYDANIFKIKGEKCEKVVIKQKSGLLFKISAKIVFSTQFLDYYCIINALSREIFHSRDTSQDKFSSWRSKNDMSNILWLFTMLRNDIICLHNFKWHDTLITINFMQTIKNKNKNEFHISNWLFTQQKEKRQPHLTYCCSILEIT